MMNPADPEGAPPRRINDVNVLNLFALLCLKRGPEAGYPRNIRDNSLLKNH